MGTRYLCLCLGGSEPRSILGRNKFPRNNTANYQNKCQQTLGYKIYRRRGRTRSPGGGAIHSTVKRGFWEAHHVSDAEFGEGLAPKGRTTKNRRACIQAYITIEMTLRAWPDFQAPPKNEAPTTRPHKH